MNFNNKSKKDKAIIGGAIALGSLFTFVNTPITLMAMGGFFILTNILDYNKKTSKIVISSEYKDISTNINNLLFVNLIYQGYKLMNGVTPMVGSQNLNMAVVGSSVAMAAFLGYAAYKESKDYYKIRENVLNKYAKKIDYNNTKTYTDSEIEELFNNFNNHYKNKPDNTQDNDTLAKSIYLCQEALLNNIDYGSEKVKATSCNQMALFDNKLEDLVGNILDNGEFDKLKSLMDLGLSVGAFIKNKYSSYNSQTLTSTPIPDEVIEFLVKNDPFKVNIDFYASLYKNMVESGNIHAINIIEEHYINNLPGDIKQYFLNQALLSGVDCFSNKTSTVKKIVDLGADIHFNNNEAMNRAVRVNNYNGAMFLESLGADFKNVDKDNWEWNISSIDSFSDMALMKHAIKIDALDLKDYKKIKNPTVVQYTESVILAKKEKELINNEILGRIKTESNTNNSEMTNVFTGLIKKISNLIKISKSNNVAGNELDKTTNVVRNRSRI